MSLQKLVPFILICTRMYSNYKHCGHYAMLTVKLLASQNARKKRHNLSISLLTDSFNTDNFRPWRMIRFLYIKCTGRNSMTLMCAKLSRKPRNRMRPYNQDAQSTRYLSSRSHVSNTLIRIYTRSSGCVKENTQGRRSSVHVCVRIYTYVWNKVDYFLCATFPHFPCFALAGASRHAHILGDRARLAPFLLDSR